MAALFSVLRSRTKISSGNQRIAPPACGATRGDIRVKQYQFSLRRLDGYACIYAGVVRSACDALAAHAQTFSADDGLSTR